LKLEIETLIPPLAIYINNGENYMARGFPMGGS